MRPWWLAAVFIGLVGLAPPTLAQDVSLGGQVRPRFEFRDSTEVRNDAFTSMRVRAHLAAALDRGVSIFIQFQDVRFWGEESSTLADFSADNFDLHQGYLEVRSSGPTTVAARLGRQELTFGGERVIGTVGWTQQGRTFDAVRLSADWDRFRVDVIGAQLAEESALGIEDDAYFLGAYAVLLDAGPGSLDLYALYDRAEGAAETNQGTFGARWVGQYSGFDLRGEGTYQTGDRADVHVAAFMFGGRVGRPFYGGAASATLWYDYLSGDDDLSDGTLRVFDTLFATNHKFYGLADYFLNIPAQTAGRGLQDFAVKGTYAPHREVSLALDVHSFHLARSNGLTSGHLGEEIDLTGTYRYSKDLRVVGGFSYLFAAEGFSEIGRFTDDAIWTYLMVDAAF